ncbi:MAG: diguanylate cyclase, partial [Nitriliruptorales bacterium]|nr:diguanylate cyclase [Nitriliruptorales bacterium]
THVTDLDSLNDPSLRGVDVVLLSIPLPSPTTSRQVRFDVPILTIVEAADEDAELGSLEEGALDWVTHDELRPEILPRAIRYVLDRHRLETELQRMAHIDPLTGLHNRRFLMKQLDAALGAARRHGHPLTLCVCDIDRFKAVNDEHGHLAGDDVLRAFATLTSEQLRREDQVARFGGDEFCLMLPHGSLDEATRAVERIRLAVEQLRVPLPDGTDLCVTATFGIAEFDPGRHPTGQSLFEAADRALYVGKQRGRNCLSLVQY